jgi:hypothetical protein
MLGLAPFYHGAVRKTVVAFGTIFQNLQIEYRQADGSLERTTTVPIAYAPKEKWYQRLREDPDFLRQFEVDLPRVSFEITGYRYDPERKMGVMKNYIPIRCNDGQDRLFAPVPWTIEFALYSYTRTQEEAFQIMEQILPFFGPVLTVTIDVIPEIGLSQDIPISLVNVSGNDNYEGSLSETRTIIYQYLFSAQTHMYGPVDNSGHIIKKVYVDLNTTPSIDSPKFEAYYAVVNPQSAGFNDPYEVDEGWVEGEDPFPPVTP